MSESKINNWYVLFKSYPDQVNHLSINRVEGQARREVACGDLRRFFRFLFHPLFFRRVKKLGNQ